MPRNNKLFAEWFWTDRWTHSRAFALPMDARGLYREMLTQAWMRGAALPADPAQVRRITGCSEKEWKRSWPLVQPFWTVVCGPDGDQLVNVTQAEVYREAVASSQRASTRGATGARAKHKQHPSSTQAALKQHSGDAQATPATVLEHKPPVSVSDPERGKEHLSLAQAGSDEVAERARRLLEERYPAWYREFRHGAQLRVVNNTLAYGDAVTVCRLWDDARIAQLAQVFLQTDDAWISGTDRSFRVFAQKATWCDDRLTQAERAAR